MPGELLHDSHFQSMSVAELLERPMVEARLSFPILNPAVDAPIISDVLSVVASLAQQTRLAAPAAVPRE
jgi:hypothetical protein